MVEMIHGYRQIRFLGRGKSGHSYLVEKEGKLFVYKKMHQEEGHENHDNHKLKNELAAYDFLVKSSLRVPKLIMYDEQQQYLIKEYIEGPTLAEQIGKGQFDMDAFLTLYAQSHCLEKQGINIDYFPTNFVVSKGEIIYIDYEINPYSEEWNFANWGSLFLFNQQGFELYLKDFRNTSKLLNEEEKPVFEPIKHEHAAFMKLCRLLNLDDVRNCVSEDEIKPCVNRVERMTSGIAAMSFKLTFDQKSYLYKVYTDLSKKALIDSEIEAYQHPLTMMPKLLSYKENNHDVWLLFEFIDGPNTMQKYQLEHRLEDVHQFTETLKMIHTHKHPDRHSGDFINEELSQIEAINLFIQDESVDSLMRCLRSDAIKVTTYPLSRIHGDYHPWNTLHQDQRLYVIDWQYRYGDYRYDVFWTYSLLYRSGYSDLARKFLEDYSANEEIEDAHFFMALANLRWFINVKQSVSTHRNNDLLRIVEPQINQLNQLISDYVNIEFKI